MTKAIDDPVRFIRDNTHVMSPPLTPEISLHLATEIVPIWQLTEEELADQGLPPPFWAFAWAGGQALARYVLDNPHLVSGKHVLDFAAGSGLAGIAAAKAGASSVLMADVDPFSVTACAMNGAANDVPLETTAEDLVGKPSPGWDVVLAGDICYEQPLATKVEDWLKAMARAGTLVLVGDPGRTYLPKTGMRALTTYQVQTTRELEDMEIRKTGVWRVEG